MVSLSESTIQRRLRQFGLSVSNTYIHIDDKKLDESVQQFVKRFPNCGYRRMDGFLMSKEIRVTEKRIRESMRRVEEEYNNVSSNLFH